ncbi:probable prefoldin subunit 5 [Culicoides brevitarsis]|uniref:probable prefoldin subunit 5 n=1 Tax=Culicoides brevitarsis TaxID=469753 RepID=UPI00307BAF52
MASNSAKPQGEYQQIDLMKLNLAQLNQLKNQLNQELVLFNDSLTTLKVAKSKYAGSKEALEQFKPSWNDNVTLVPLTGSMYVPGKFKDINNVLVDIGTGYYIEMNLDTAKDYFKRRVEFVTEQMDKIEKLGLEKSRIRDAIQEVMTIKVQQQMAAQQAAAGTAGAQKA